MARILCIDDEPHVVTLKCAILESAGHTVTASSSAHDAIDKLKHNTYDAVVTDWRLGDANGRAVVQAAKTHSDRKSTRLNSSHLVISYAVFCLKNKILQILRDAIDILGEPPSLWLRLVADYFSAGPLRTLRTLRQALRQPIATRLPLLHVPALV